MSFKSICDGYGFKEVPAEISRDAVCRVCQSKWPGKLYTQERLPTSSNLRDYSRQADAVRLNCYCRDHVVSQFGD